MWMMGAGSARPVVSISTRRNCRWPSREKRQVMSRRVLTKSPRMVQHRQPLLISVTRFSVLWATSRWSSAISPNSLMMTSASANSGRRTRWLSTVVLPLPRNPVSKVTGIRLEGDLSVIRKLLRVSKPPTPPRRARAGSPGAGYGRWGRRNGSMPPRYAVPRPRRTSGSGR